MCGPCPEAGTPGRVTRLLSLPRLPASLRLTSETVHSLGLKSASQLTQAVDMAHGSWLLAVGERCPGLLAHDGPTTAVGSGESALVTWNVTVVGSNSVVAPACSWETGPEMAAPQRGGGASGTGGATAGAEPQKELQEQIADPEQDAGGLSGQSSKSAGQIRATACPTTETHLGALGKAQSGPLNCSRLRTIEVM